MVEEQNPITIIVRREDTVMADMVKQYQQDHKRYYVVVDKEGKVITNARRIAGEVNKMRTKRRIGGEASEQMKRAVIKGTRRQMVKEGRISNEAPMFIGAFEQAPQFWDDLSGEPLDSKEVKEARRKEMEEFSNHGVYEKVPLQECYDNTGKAPIGIRWVDINKGDSNNPEYRSRLVAKEINTGKRDDLFAAMPPLEAVKMLLALATTRSVNRARKGKVMKLEFIDVSRAYFHALVRRLVYIDLPEEDAQEGMCGRLVKSMYGTRDAAQNWERAYSNFMEEAGFTRGVASPCMFWHKERDIKVVIHGDDFTLLGYDEDLDWFRTVISEKFEVKFRGRLGPDEEDDKHIRVLNRVVEWTSKGLRYEADQRHAEIVVRDAGLKEGSNGLGAPSAHQRSNEDERLLDKSEASKYRAGVARLNYAAQDRSDIQFAVKELSRKMAAPDEGDKKALKRLARYLVDKTRVVQHYDWQNDVPAVKVWTDTDFAGCKTTRKSTSGGVIQVGNHVVKSWSSTQQVIALSSGEAEYYGMVKGASHAIGVRNMLKDWGVTAGIELATDASAAKGISCRRGLGKVRHLEVTQLWLQEKVALGEISVHKIHGSVNVADALTKYVDKTLLQQHMRQVKQSVETGRHVDMPTLQ